MPTGGIRVRTSGIMIPAFVAPTTVTPSYIGPGDLGLPTPTYWNGMRAFSAATIGSVCCRIRANDGSSADFTTDTTGLINMSSVNDFLTAHGGPGNVSVMYNQAGTGSSWDFIPDGGASLPFFYSSLGVTAAFGSTDALRVLASTAAIQLSSNWTMNMIGRSEAGVGSLLLLINERSPAIESYLGYRVASSGYVIFNGVGEVVSSAQLSSFFAVTGVANGSSDYVRVNNLVGTSGDVGNGMTAARSISNFGNTTFGGTAGQMAEQALWGTTTLSSDQITSLVSNQRTFWGI